MLYFFAFVGIVCIAYFARQAFYRLRLFYKGHFTSPAVDFKSLGKYAVVTGATDGIGKAYAFELAKYGMDIILVSRSPSKLDSTAFELRNLFPDIDVKIITADFNETDGLYDRIERELAGVDVGVLVNNVGTNVNALALVGEMTRDEIMQMFNINMISAAMMSNIVLSRMADKKKGAVINISSITAALPPVYAMYSCSKTWLSRFSYALRLHYHPLGIIIQDVCPGFVTTNLVNNITDYGFVTAETCARQSLKTVGHYDTTNGAVIHEIIGFIMSLIPEGQLFKSICEYNKKLLALIEEKAKSD